MRLQIDRILASAAFADAPGASRLLRFVVDRTLDGRPGEIKESVIAVEVLGRPPSFNAKVDAIVRVEAGRLRERLRYYYETEGQADAILISLPRGRYVPEFTDRRIEAAPSRGVVRLSILPPDNTTFESFAVSPDGRKLAFTAAVDGRMMLWVRALDSLEARPLAGTDRAAWPFWSPDSSSIGFFVPTKLKVVDIRGGPPRDVADAVVGHGGAWSTAGVILFCPRPIGVLYQVAATGGTPAPVTSLNEARAEVCHGCPQFLPGGREFVYLAASGRPGESSIRVGSLESTNSKMLLSGETSAAYAPILQGHSPSLLFVHDGALMAQAFDAERLALTGERTVMVPRVRYQRWNQAGFSVSDNGLLLYQGGCAEGHQLTWFERHGKQLSVVGPRNDYRSLSLSPDEKYIAVNRFDDPGTAWFKIWVVDLLREGAVFRFTDADVAEADFAPVWSPDGREILFSRGDDRRMRLLRQRLSGGTAQCVADSEGPKFPSDWSSDNGFVAYSSQVPDYRYMHTWIVPLNGSTHERLPRPFLQHSYEEFSAQFSPAREGDVPRWIAYVSHETGRYEVYVRDFPDGAHKWQVSTQGGLQPHWRADGRELFYITPDGTLMSVAVNPGATFQAGGVQPLFATGLRFLRQDANWMNQWGVCRDGQRFVLNRPVLEPEQGAITAVIPW